MGLLVGFLGLFSVSHTQAALIAADDFESYASDSGLNGGSGGTSWASDWTTATDVMVRDGVVPGLGQSMAIEGGGTRSDVAHRGFTTQNDPSTAIYVGMLLRAEEFASSNFLQFYVNSDEEGSENQAVSFGVRNTTNNPFYARVGSSTNPSTTEPGSGYTRNSTTAFFTAGETYSVVAKFTKSGSLATDVYDRVEVFVDRADESVADVVADADDAYDPSVPRAHSVADLGMLNFRLFGISTSGANDIWADSVKVGTSYAEVMTVVPEPGTLALAIVGLLAAAGFVWRRRAR